ncbi:chaplin [Streptomyces sp. NPDC058045]|uniref:chaplin n=1 Tax=Streptomyces sp. NPDC058045 TaxID=3346311 RepID=UPI0036E02525
MRMRSLAAATALAGAVALGAAGVASAHDGDGGGASAKGLAAMSPGVLSGNVVQVPIDVPINACGNSVNVVGLLNPAFGNACINK